MDRFKPTHVLFEAAERFLRHLPTEGESTSDVLVEKLQTGDERTTSAVSEWLAEAQPPLDPALLVDVDRLRAAL